MADLAYFVPGQTVEQEFIFLDATTRTPIDILNPVYDIVRYVDGVETVVKPSAPLVRASLGTYVVSWTVPVLTITDTYYIHASGQHPTDLTTTILTYQFYVNTITPSFTPGPAYCTLADIENFVQLAQLVSLTNDTDIDPTTINVIILNDTIRRADNYINSFIRGRYTLPLTAIPESIRDLSIKLTTYYLFRRSLTTEVPKLVQDDWKDSNVLLKDIQAGRFNPFEVALEPTFFKSSKVDLQPTFATQYQPHYLE